MLGCPKCLHIADGAFWGIMIESQRHLKLLESIVASLQGRADINAEVARDSNELVVQWYKKYESSQKDLEIARKAINQVMSMGAKNNICYHLKAKTVKSILGNALKQIEHKENNNE